MKKIFILFIALLAGRGLYAMDDNLYGEDLPRVAVTNDPTDTVIMATGRNLGAIMVASPMADAINRGNLEQVKSLIDKSQDKNYSIKNAMFDAGRFDKREVAVFLLNTYTFASSSVGLASLLNGAGGGNGHIDLVKLALEKGANIEGSGEATSNTPLERAVLRGNAQIVKYLIEQGASVNMRPSKSQATLLRLVSMGDYHVTIRVILTTIPLSEAQKIKAAVASIKFGTPFPRDIRNLMTLKLIRLFTQQHMVYAQKLLDGVGAGYVSSKLKQAIADLREPQSWNAIRQEVETNFRRVLARPLERAGVSQLTREQQEDVNAFLKSIEGRGAVSEKSK